MYKFARNGKSPNLVLLTILAILLFETNIEFIECDEISIEKYLNPLFVSMINNFFEKQNIGYKINQQNWIKCHIGMTISEEDIIITDYNSNVVLEYNIEDIDKQYLIYLKLLEDIKIKENKVLITHGELRWFSGLDLPSPPPFYFNSKEPIGKFITIKPSCKVANIKGNVFISNNKSFGKLKIKYIIFPKDNSSEEIFKDSVISDGIIGIYLSKNNLNRYCIVKVIENTPAYKKMLREGDIIESIDGREINNLSLFDVICLIRGIPETFIEMEIVRKNKRYKKLIKRKSIDILNK